MNGENKKLYILLAIFSIIFTFFGGSLAYWQWNSTNEQKTNIALTVTQDFRCDADGGGDILSEDKYLVPTDCTNTNYAIQRTVTVAPTLYQNNFGVSLDLWLNVNQINTGLSNCVNFKYAITTNENSCTEDVIKSGNFKGKGTNSKLPLLEDKLYRSSTDETYYLYIWLDKAETSTATMDQKFNISLNGNCTGVEIGNTLIVEEPILDPGMVPIIFENGGSVTVADTSTEWYDYQNKEWANAVLVKENATDGTSGSYSREYYLNNPGTPVLESDILAYYVWIPRYKYKIWTTTPSSAGNERTIDIVFEETNATKSTGTSVGQYLTHPAFTFGDEELPGFWVGKFETTGNTTTPTVKPNLKTILDATVGTYFKTSLKFAGGTLSDGNVTFSGSSTYGLTANSDSHMMKNSEWGAVAYLTQSKYGINRELYINNSNYYTGRSGGNVGGSVLPLATHFSDSSLSSTNQYNEYGYYTWKGQAIDKSGTVGSIGDATLGTKASTTGNITGIYDMSGSAYEYVMGHHETASSDKSELGTFPPLKYHDVYSSSIFTSDPSNNMTFCTIATCGGHALFETRNWYTDHPYFVRSTYPWFVRGGGHYSDGTSAGIYTSGYNTGAKASSYGFRQVLIARNETE